MNTQDQLRENYEDALFAMLMGELAEEEGKRLLEENERLKNDPAAAVPEHINRSCRKAIRKSFARSHRKTAAVTARSAFRKVLVAAMVSVLLLVTAYASFPSFRLKALNLLIEVSNVATSLVPTDKGSDYDIDTSETRDNLGSYLLPQLPDEFVVEHEGHDRTSDWIRYTNKQGATIFFRVESSTKSGLHADTENADSSENILLHGYDALLVEKEDWISINWFDESQYTFILISATGMDRASILSYAEELTFVGAE